jgi:hypothetical protein
MPPPNWIARVTADTLAWRESRGVKRGQQREAVRPTELHAWLVGYVPTFLADWFVQHGYDLRLMTWGDGSGVPTSGTRLIVLGTDNTGRLHIRIFDADGNRATDTDETKLPGTEAGAIATLKEQLPGLLPPRVLTSDEKSQLLSEVTLITGQPPQHGVALAPHEIAAAAAAAAYGPAWTGPPPATLVGTLARSFARAPAFEQRDIERVLVYGLRLPPGFRLRLMPSITSAGELPTSDKNLVIAARMGKAKLMHFRVFDPEGTMVVDIDETSLPGQAGRIGKLKERLEGLWTIPVLSGSDRDGIASSVTSIVACARGPWDLLWDGASLTLVELVRHQIKPQVRQVAAEVLKLNDFKVFSDYVRDESEECASLISSVLIKDDVLREWQADRDPLDRFLFAQAVGTPYPKVNGFREGRLFSADDAGRSRVLSGNGGESLVAGFVLICKLPGEGTRRDGTPRPCNGEQQPETDHCDRRGHLRHGPAKPQQEPDWRIWGEGQRRERLAWRCLSCGGLFFQYGGEARESKAPCPACQNRNWSPRGTRVWIPAEAVYVYKGDQADPRSRSPEDLAIANELFHVIRERIDYWPEVADLLQRAVARGRPPWADRTLAERLIRDLSGIRADLAETYQDRDDVLEIFDQIIGELLAEFGQGGPSAGEVTP